MTQKVEVSDSQQLTALEALRLLDQLKSGSSPEPAPATGTKPDRETLRARLAAELQELVLSVLKLPVSEFSATTPLLDYGLDSIAATEIGTLFTQRFQITVPPTAFFEFPDLHSFCGFLVETNAEQLAKRYGGNTTPPIAKESGKQGAKPVSAPRGPAVDSGIAAGSKPQQLRAKANPTGETLSIEDLWNIENAEVAAATAGAQPLAAVSPSKPETRGKEAPAQVTQQPTRAELQSMMRAVERARLVTIQRKGGGVLECAIFGQGRPVLMLGGLLMHFSAMWRPQLEELGAGYRLIMFHMPGCGNVPLDENLSLSGLVSDVHELLDGLGLDEPLPVVGCSFGGVLAQAFCLAHPERCASLTVCVSTPVAEGATDFRCLMQELQSSSTFMEINRGWPMASLPAYTNVIEGFDLRQKLANLRIPTLVIAGGRDRYTTPAHSRMIAESVPGARLIEISDAGHLLPFTHHEIFNRHVLAFLREREASPAPRADGLPLSVYLPTTPDVLTRAEAYVTDGEQGHCVILPAVAAQLAFLINHLCNIGRAPRADYRTYFVTSVEEALDAALRLARHRARNRAPDSAGKVVIVDRGRRWANYFDPLRQGIDAALVPGVCVVSSCAAAEKLLEEALPGGIAAVVFVAGQEMPGDEADRLFAHASEKSALNVLVDLDKKETPFSGSLAGTLQADIFVLGEGISGFEMPVAACAVKSTVANPWLMTPNEGYVRQPMAAMGLPLAVALDFLASALALSPSLRAELDTIAETPQATFDAHLKYGNIGYARVARMHGYDGRFDAARGMRSRLKSQNGSTREITDCLLNVGTSPRGLNPSDIVPNVLRTHDPAHDYWGDLQALLKRKTGMAVALPASSQTAAIEVGVTLGLIAAAPRKKLLCFSGGAGFSMLSATTAFDPIFDLFRRPFQPLYPHVVCIDPKAENAETQLRLELLSGDIALVWLETIQVEGNAVRPLPEHLIRAVNECREQGGYLVAVDETQTNLWTGSFLHSEGLVPSPDMVAIASGLCDSLLPAGAVLATSTTFERAATQAPQRVQELRGRHACQMTAHLALNALQAIDAGGTLETARAMGAYFKDSLERLAKECPLVCDVRGAGLLLSIELDLSGRSEFVQRSFGYLLWGAMLRDPEGGVAVVVCPIHNNCLRLVPSLNITKDEIDAVVSNLRRQLSSGIDAVILACADYNDSLGEARTAAFLRGQAERANIGKGNQMQSKPISFKSEAQIPPLKATAGLPTVCIIGAGVGGVSMAGALQKKGIPFDCFDKRDRIGGIWAFDAKRENTSVWSTLNMNTPRGLYQFSDFPMPATYPDFPQWQQVQSYLESYVDHLGMRSHFHLGQGVESARRIDGRWHVGLASGEMRIYDVLIVANGHHNTPNLPAYGGNDNFKGTAIHSRHYRSRHEFRDKRVLIVGIGNSGSQIAVDVSYDAKITYISLRRGVYLMPHYMFGIRMDKLLGPSLSWWFKKLLPNSLYPRFFTLLYNLMLNHRQIGMPKPDHLMMTCLPTVTESLANRIGDGKIKLVPEVKSIDGNTVSLSDGNTIEVDAIIYSTGYQTTLPFFDKDFFEVKDNKVPLYKRIFLPGVPNLAFVGMFQAIRWGFLDVMEAQAKLISEYLFGKYQLPDVEDQRSEIERERQLVEKEFMHTLRNNYYLHGDTYVHELKLETKRGRKRVDAGGFGSSLSSGENVVSNRNETLAAAE